MSVPANIQLCSQGYIHSSWPWMYINVNDVFELLFSGVEWLYSMFNDLNMHKFEFI